MTNKLATTAPMGLMTQPGVHTGETAALAVAAQAKASIEARWLVAVHQPRNLDTVRSELLRECKRPSFAAVGMYKKPIGAGIEGLSIRFVEAALQCMGNVDTEVITIYDDSEKRIVEVRVTDFQRNVGHKKQITVSKLVERRSLRRGQVALSQRTNSGGQTVYLVAASEDDLLNKEGAMVSKAIRTCGLRIIPGWLQDEAIKTIKATAGNEASRDPDAERRKILDGFGGLGIRPEGLAEYLGHPLEQIVATEMADLRVVWETIKDGEATWVDILTHRLEQRGDAQAAAGEAVVPKPAKGTQAVKDRLAAQQAKGAAARRAKIEANDAKVAPSTPEHDFSEGKTPQTVQTPPAATLKTEVDRAAETKPAEPAEKRPSRSQAAQEERREQVVGLPVLNSKAAQLFIQYGDPRNLTKGYGDPMDTPEAQTEPPTMVNEQQAKIDAMQAKLNEQRASAKESAEAQDMSVTDDGTRYNPDTGEVVEDTEEPAWMSGGAPEGEGF